jgi:hypothetical protein
MQNYRALIASLMLMMMATSNAFTIISLDSTISCRMKQFTRIQSTVILQQSDGDDYDEEEDYDDQQGEEFFVSPANIKVLRKEATKREVGRELPKFVLPPDEQSEISEETLSGIINLFDEAEIIEVKNISKNAKRYVYATTNDLAALLEEEMGQPVVIVSIKGFTARLYSPWVEEDRRGRIVLRTSYRPNQWKKRPRPVRDNRGQVIRGEDGKSIKE